MRCRLLPEEKLDLLTEKNQVMLNLLRDVMENEISVSILPAVVGDDVVERAMRDRSSRRREITGEIEYLLYREYIMSPLEG